jgi:hypothetical protein
MAYRKGSSVIKKSKQMFMTFSSVILLLSLSACGSSGDSAQSGIALKPGEAISFSENITGGEEDGWSLPDSGGTWSQSKRAILKLNYGSEFANGMNLSLKSMGFISKNGQATSVTISANGVEVKKIEFSQSQLSAEISFDVSREILSSNKGPLILSFYIPEAVSPESLGINGDVRELGIFLLELIPNKI